MKKIFTFFAAALAAMMIYADPVDPNREYLSLERNDWDWGYNCSVFKYEGGLHAGITSEWGALSTGWDPERDLSEWDKIVIVVDEMEGCAGEWFKLKAYLRDESESEANQMEGLLGLDAVDTVQNYLVIDLHQEKPNFDLTKCRVLAIQCQPQDAEFTISSVYLLKEEDPEPAKERVILGVKFPATGAPTAGVKVYGSFTEDAVDLEYVAATGWYVHYNVMASANDMFSFVDAADPCNKIYMLDATDEWEPGLFNFGTVWADDTWKGDPVKIIELDLTDTTKYNWYNAFTEGIDNITTDVKAVKRIVNGQLLIEKNGKFYNATGAEVK